MIYRKRRLRELFFDFRKLRDASVRCRSYFALRKVGLTYLITNSGDDITVTSLQVN